MARPTVWLILNKDMDIIGEAKTSEIIKELNLKSTAHLLCWLLYNNGTYKEKYFLIEKE